MVGGFPWTLLFATNGTAEVGQRTCTLYPPVVALLALASDDT